jgi:hypothetical protein
MWTGGRARFNAPDSKSGWPARVTGVQIPPCPPFLKGSKFHVPGSKFKEFFLRLFTKDGATLSIQESILIT